ncbi:MAG TPA: carboxypeptidase-like regulatory domain-containing protein, partial [Candidatus Polarisedimenticolia bacterium]|nr:carboxypeptidase-like regulatory domain-containing protein [Candidatus Polarisedimenticolia bacterium]
MGPLRPVGARPLRRIGRLLLSLALLVGGGAFPARAQSVTGSLTGTVRDAAGAPLAGATVIARSLETGAERSILSDREGRYRFELLTPGSWTVSARLGGDPPGQTIVASIVLQ